MIPVLNGKEASEALFGLLYVFFVVSVDPSLLVVNYDEKRGRIGICISRAVA